MGIAETKFLSVFSFSSPNSGGNAEREYRLEARIASASGWRFLGMTDRARVGSKQNEFRLATAIVQALDLAEAT